MSNKLKQSLNSIKNNQWFAQTIINQNTELLANNKLLPKNIIHLLSTRNIEIENLDNFFSPKLKTSIPNPMNLIDMEKAANRFIDAIIKKEKIAILADYDVDGAASAAMIKKYLNILDINNTIVYVPDRIAEGYGPNSNAFKILKKTHNIKLCITVDCGIIAHESIQTAANIGIDIIVLDHHIGDYTIPPAVAVVDPNRKDEKCIHKNLSAAGVVFLFLIATQSLLRERKFFDNQTEPNLINFLDLVALSTICDVVPLTGLNRLLVKKGLEIINKQKNLGLNALAMISNANFPLTEQNIAFSIGPRINACGRIGDGLLAVDLLTNDNYDTIYAIALKIDKLNNARKLLDTKVYNDIINCINLNKLEHFILQASKEWHPGVIGIAAGRVKEQFNITTIVITINDQNIGKASMRGVEGINCGAIVYAAKQKGIIINGGGHNAAAGFSIDMINFSMLQTFLLEFFEKQTLLNQNNKKYFDLIIPPNELNLKTFNEISLLSPFGIGNPEPIILIENVTIKNITIIKNEHILIKAFGNNTYFKAIAFRANKIMMDAIKIDIIVSLVGTISLNQWNGTTNINFIIQDIIL